MSQLLDQLRIECLDDGLLTLAQAASDQLQISLNNPAAAFALQATVHGWQLQELGAGAPGPLRVDFVEGGLAHRRRFGGGAGQMLAKAVGIQGQIRPQVLDATAGLGRDAFVLACLGCQVQLLERNPLVAWLLADGLRRAASDSEPELVEIIARMQLLGTDAIVAMRNWQTAPPQVVYLDPMFPEREKSALVKKEMRLLQPLVGKDEDAQDLFAAAWELASHRVVVKRPRKAPQISAQPPSYQLLGKACRYDIYTRQSLKNSSKLAVS